MKRALIAMGLLALSACAQADESEDFIRISCMPEIGVLDVDYRAIHTSSANRLPEGGSLADQGIAKYGFYSPTNLTQTCALKKTTYRVVATQAEPRAQGKCGGAPEINLSIFAGNKPLIKKVVFGDGCKDTSSLIRVTIRPGTGKGKTQEAEICLKNGTTGLSRCEWFFESIPESWAAFPIGQDFVDLRMKRYSSAD